MWHMCMEGNINNQATHGCSVVKNEHQNKAMWKFHSLSVTRKNDIKNKYVSMFIQNIEKFIKSPNLLSFTSAPRKILFNFDWSICYGHHKRKFKSRHMDGQMDGWTRPFLSPLEADKNSHWKFKSIKILTLLDAKLRTFMVNWSNVMTVVDLALAITQGSFCVCA